jgi:roadblock/LC7 domain-containing protein
MSYRSLENTIRFGPVEEEKDYEGQMARAQLQMIAKRAAALAEMMTDDMQLEAWVQSKITTAEDYVTTVHDYMTTRKGN